MHWLFQYRSKNLHEYDVEDTKGEKYSPLIRWHGILLLPFEFIFLIFVDIFESIVVALAPFILKFYKIVKTTSESGKFKSPGLVFTGIVITVILPTLILNCRFSVSDHPFITLCSLIFVLYSTIAPLTGLVLRFFKITIFKRL